MSKERLAYLEKDTYLSLCFRCIDEGLDINVFGINADDYHVNDTDRYFRALEALLKKEGKA